MKSLGTKRIIIVGLVLVAVAAGLLYQFRNKAPHSLTVASVIAIYWKGDGTAPNGLGSIPLPAGDFIIAISNQYPDNNQREVHQFLEQATNQFILKSPGHPDVSAHLSNAVINSQRIKLESFEAKVDGPDVLKLVHGGNYTIEPVGDAQRPVHWSIPNGLKVKVP